MIGLQEISDRIEIQDLAIRYSTAIDSDLDLLDSVFTPDAQIDYTAMGGIAGRYPEVKAWLRTALAGFSNFQHMIGNHVIGLDGDQASGRLICFNPMGVVGGDGRTMFLGLWYEDRYVRASEGWRIASRNEVHCYSHNVPDGVRTTAREVAQAPGGR